MKNEPLLTAENISVAYARDFPVLRSVSLELRAGRILAVIGPNGAGKSTLFRALSGELPVSSGTVRVVPRASARGTTLDPHAMPARKRALHIARVLQNEQPAWPVSVRDYVESGLFAREGWFGLAPAGSARKVTRSLERLGIVNLASRLVTELSGGEFRRVVIARALVQDPEIFLLDEPTADLDMAHQIETLDIIRMLARSGKAVAFSVHDLNQAALAADEIALITHGTIAARGTPGAVLTGEIIKKAYGADVIVGNHPSGRVPHIILDPDWLKYPS